MPATILRVERDGLYSVESLTKALQLRKYTVRRECKHGRMRYAVCAGRIVIRGTWVFEWVDACERTRRRQPEQAAPTGASQVG